MSLETLALNPYSSPNEVLSEPVFCESGYSIHVASRLPFYRKLLISGPCPGIIEYNAAGPGCEIVRVNRVEILRVASPTFFGRTLTSPIEFEIPSEYGPQPVRLELKAFLWLVIAAFRISIGGEVVYAEGQWNE